MRGRGLALVAGARMGQARAQQEYEQKAELQEAQQQAAAPAAAPATDDTTAQLKKLADLHAQGVLTDEEFAASKKKLLGI